MLIAQRVKETCKYLKKSTLINFIIQNLELIIIIYWRILGWNLITCMKLLCIEKFYSEKDADLQDFFLFNFQVFDYSTSL